MTVWERGHGHAAHDILWPTFSPRGAYGHTIPTFEQLCTDYRIVHLRLEDIEETTFARLLAVFRSPYYSSLLRADGA